MYKLEMDPTVCRMIQIYRRIGFWESDDVSGFRKLCMRFLNFFQPFSFFFFIFSGICQAYLSEDNNQLIFLVDIQISGILVLVKSYYLLWRKDLLSNFLYDPIVAHCTNDNGELVLVNEIIKKIVSFNKVYFYMMNLATLFLVLLPMRTIFSDEKLLPLFIRFDLENEFGWILHWMGYGLGFVYASYGVFLYAFLAVMSSFIWYIMYNYSIEYKLLGDRFRSLGTKRTNVYQRDLIHLIKSHKNLFNTVERFRSSFAPLFLVEVVTGAVFICVSTFNVTYNTPDNYFEMGIYIAAMLHAFSEIFLTMYVANAITDESDRITYSLFESNWIAQSESTKKSVFIFCEMIMTPQQMVVFIYPMNLQKFTSMVNGAYSMFNILQSFK